MAAVVVALSVAAVAIFGQADDEDVPASVMEAAKFSLACGGPPPTDVRCEPLKLDRWRCTSASSGNNIVELEGNHPEVSVIC